VSLTRDKYLGVVSMQFKLNSRGELERVEKNPLPLDVNAVFNGRDAVESDALQKAMKKKLEQAGSKTSAGKTKPKVIQPTSQPISKPGTGQATPATVSAASQKPASDASLGSSTSSGNSGSASGTTKPEALTAPAAPAAAGAATGSAQPTN
jgi:hypothetical protein